MAEAILPIYSHNMMHPGLKAKIKPSFLKGNWNRMTKLMFQIGTFIECYTWRLENKRDNAVIIEGERGEGKTNTMLFLLMLFNYYFKVPFSQFRSVYLGREVDLTVNFIKETHQPFESIAIDESEICFSMYRATSIQNREAKIFMDTFRDLQLGVFFVCPDKGILDTRIVERCNWNIICDWNDIETKEVEVTIEYYGRYKDKTHFEWLMFDKLILPWVPAEIYRALYRRKNTKLYTRDGMTDFHETRKEKDKAAQLQKRAERAVVKQKIIDSKNTVSSKILELLRLGVTKSDIISLLRKEEGVDNFRVKQMEQEYLIEVARAASLKKESKDLENKKKK